jgi:hypothetical protein
VFAAKFDVERDLISLIHDWPVAAHHFANVEMFYARDIFQKFICAGHDRVGGFRFCGVGPKNDNVAELSGSFYDVRFHI